MGRQGGFSWFDPELKTQLSEIRYDPFIRTRAENITQLELKTSSARDRNPLRMVFSSIEPLLETLSYVPPTSCIGTSPCVFLCHGVMY
jgi:hypothetical protein